MVAVAPVIEITQHVVVTSWPIEATAGGEIGSLQKALSL